MTLRDRCAAFLDRMSRRAVMRVGSPVDLLVDFVVSENGRAGADGLLEEKLPVCLYFDNQEDREAFVEAARAAMPGARIRKI